jgi:hypothetical protein
MAKVLYTFVLIYFSTEVKVMRKSGIYSGLLVLALVSVLSVSALVIAAGGTTVYTRLTRTVDGDPGDWIGAFPRENSWQVSNGEGIWEDGRGDDRGPGTYIYPTGTHDGLKQELGYAPKIYTEGSVDLTEFRICADDQYLYVLFRLRNMGLNIVATQWGAEKYGFGRQLIQVAIDTDRVSGSGRTDLVEETYHANAKLSADAAWEWLICIDGYTPMVYSTTQGFDLELIGGKLRANASNDTIEVAVPLSTIGDPTGKTWRFTVSVGGYDEGHYRQVWNTTLAENDGWPPYFRFMGGEGRDPPNAGLDPNIMDIAFTISTTQQQSILSEYKTTGAIVEIDAYQDITFGLPSSPPLLTVETGTIAVSLVVIAVLAYYLWKARSAPVKTR